MKCKFQSISLSQAPLRYNHWTYANIIIIIRLNTNTNDLALSVDNIFDVLTFKSAVHGHIDENRTRVSLSREICLWIDTGALKIVGALPTAKSGDKYLNTM